MVKYGEKGEKCCTIIRWNPHITKWINKYIKNVYITSENLQKNLKKSINWENVT